MEDRDCWALVCGKRPVIQWPPKSPSSFLLQGPQPNAMAQGFLEDYWVPCLQANESLIGRLGSWGREAMREKIRPGGPTRVSAQTTTCWASQELNKQ